MYDASERSHAQSLAFVVHLRYVGTEKQHQEYSAVAKLLRLSLATLTLLVFFYPANELFLSAGLGAYRI